MKNKVFVLVALLVAIAVFAGLKLAVPTAPASKNETSSPSPNGTSLQTSIPVFVRPHSPTYGTPVSRVTVVEWFDPECESCRAIHPVFKKLVADYGGRVHFALRYMPFHGNSLFAAAALEEAREIGRFEEALDVLFETQPQWGDHQKPRPELIVEALTKLGVPAARLDRDTVINKHREKILTDEKDGVAAGVQGTPSFFVNGQSVGEFGEQPLRQAIESALGR